MKNENIENKRSSNPSIKKQPVAALDRQPASLMPPTAPLNRYYSANHPSSVISHSLINDCPVVLNDNPKPHNEPPKPPPHIFQVPYNSPSERRFLEPNEGSKLDQPKSQILKPRQNLPRSQNSNETLVPNQVKSPKPVTIAKPKLIKNDCLLDYSDVEELRAHRKLLSPLQNRYLEMVIKKKQIHPERFRDPHYLSNSALLIMSDWPSITNYAFCCIRSTFNPLGVCRLRHFCPYCAYRARQEALTALVPAFYAGHWYSVTLSFKGDLPFAGASASACLGYWDACKKALRGAVDEKVIRGVYATEEIAVRQFLPLRVIPHMHAVVDAESFGPEAVQTLTSSIQAFRTEEGAPLELVPDIKVKSITSERSLMDRVGYLIKPINLVNRYQAAWPNVLGNNRKEAWRINSEVAEFTTGFSEITKMRKKILSKGTLHANNPGYIGIKAAERDEYKEYIRELAQEQEPSPTETANGTNAQEAG